ncbi:TetR/AcrR family transcriptional regulator [Marinifilum caeruleilacunae]|uniref:TetR/AcrR family transcriptional regulator n=1 Tax=Marinifilum caeruleilacunae TaxID=2499076 RepID=A0ABX1X0B5_9BACT|nr:TetR/AcrR family transcriptional regulator [Marinifilum caeruleilacunae]NOU61549.1 TetR/AcrR family transcriptional regulator [Marinifilum caeruleilacunae]
MKNQKEDIIEVCWELFFQFGIRSVTMDDIAAKLGISKKTIYQHFSNKTDLVEQAIEWQINHPKFSFMSENMSQLNAIDQYIEFYRFVVSQISNSCESMRYDLRKYYPKLWHKFHLEKLTRFQSELSQNLQQGIDEGLFRPEVNIEFISKTMARFYLNMVEADNVILEKEDIENIEYHKELGTYHLHGVCTEKGIEYFKNNF